MELKDGGHGITEKSLEYWDINKHKLGEIINILVTAEPLLEETQKYNDSLEYTVEYNFKAEGTMGTMFLSGCNCGYGGTGPNGTAKILIELGIPHASAKNAIMGKKIEFCPEQFILIVDGKEYGFPLPDIRTEISALDEFIDEIEYERAREVLVEMKHARNGDDGEYYDD